MRTRFSPLVTFLTLVALGVAALLILPGADTKTVNAEFDRTVGLFVGSDVRVMGMRVGKVSRITPHGTGVDVEMTYEAQYRLPADAKAVIVAPSVIADRFVQLTPGWAGGPVLASGAVIAKKDTRVPVELDRSIAVTTDLMKALGPDAGKAASPLADSVSALAEIMRGNGADTREALRQVAAATDVLADGSDDLGGTIEHLAGLTGTLADYDHSVRRFNRQLGDVADTLADDSGQLSALLRTLASTLGEVASFVADNRAALSTDVRRLSAVTTALLKERASLVEVADIAPLAFTDLVETYDPAAKAVRTRANFTEILRTIDNVVCDTVAKSAGDALKPVCSALATLLDQLPIRAGLEVPTP